METKRFTVPQLEALMRLRFGQDMQELAGVLLTYQQECIDDLRTLREPADIYAAQGRCDAIEQVLKLFNDAPDILSTRRKSGGS